MVTPACMADDAISAFYDAALGRMSWPAAAASAARMFNAHAAVLSAHDPQGTERQRTLAAFSSDGPDASQGLAIRQLAQSAFSARLLSGKPGNHAFSLFGRQDVDQCPFLHRWSAPRPLHDFLVF